jgi:hypothetical protein
MPDVRRLAVGLLAGVLACEPQTVAPPSAEFIISAGDSVFWVRADAEGVRVRGAPMRLAKVDGRFVELYVTDEDLSFYDAVFVAQRLYKRDLITGDSLLLVADTAIPALAQAFARAHPGERLLEPDEEGASAPRTEGYGTLDAKEANGPWLFYEHQVDLDVIGGRSSHGARLGGVDLRTGAPLTLEAVVGAREGAQLAARGAELATAWRALQREEIARDPANAWPRELDRIAFDPRSFRVVNARGDSAGGPELRFALVQSEAEEEIGTVELASLPLTPPPWWAREARRFASYTPEGQPVWSRPGVQVIDAIVPEAEDRIAFFLMDSLGRRTPIGTVPKPLRELLWVGDSADAPGTSAALLRAFNEAALYSEDARVVRSRPAPTFRYAGWSAGTASRKGTSISRPSLARITGPVKASRASRPRSLGSRE